MNVINNRRPPNWAEIQKHFPGADENRVVVTYGNDVYMPTGLNMYPDLRAHEAVHVRQQNAMGVEAWWDRFYVDPQFRMEQELEAYQAQYVFMKGIQRNREKLAAFLRFCAKELSGPTYGNMVTFGEALKKIRGAA